MQNQAEKSELESSFAFFFLKQKNQCYLLSRLPIKKFLQCSFFFPMWRLSGYRSCQHSSKSVFGNSFSKLPTNFLILLHNLGITSHSSLNLFKSSSHLCDSSIFSILLFNRLIILVCSTLSYLHRLILYPTHHSTTCNF